MLSSDLFREESYSSGQKLMLITKMPRLNDGVLLIPKWNHSFQRSWEFEENRIWRNIKGRKCGMCLSKDVLRIWCNCYTHVLTVAVINWMKHGQDWPIHISSWIKEKSIFPYPTLSWETIGSSWLLRRESFSSSTEAFPLFHQIISSPHLDKKLI